MDPFVLIGCIVYLVGGLVATFRWSDGHPIDILFWPITLVVSLGLMLWGRLRRRGD